MRILYIYESIKREVGYVENNLPREVAKLGYEVIMVVPRSTSNIVTLQEKYSKGSLSIFALSELLHFKLGGKSLMPRVLQVLLKFRPNIVSSPYLNPSLVFIVIPLKFFLRYKVIATIGMPVDTTRHTKPIAILYILFKKFISPLLKRYVDLFIEATYENVKRDIEEFHLSRDKIFFMPLGVDTILFKKDGLKRSQTRKMLGIYEDEVVYTYSAYIINKSKEKGVEILIDSFARLLKSCRNGKLLIIGHCEADFLNWIQQKLSKYEISKNVILLKPVPNRELPNFYNASDVGVWPIGPSISIQQMMASGLPVIINKSFLGHVHHLFKYNNELLYNNKEELYLCMKKLYENQEFREKVGTINRKLAEDELDWGIIARKLSALYFSLIQSNSSK